MKILNFGGTSVGSPERMRQVKDIITRDDEQKIVVLSAVSGTTNSLVEIGEALYLRDKNGAHQLIEDLYTKYIDFVEGLYSDQDILRKGQSVIDTHFGVIRGLLEIDFTDKEERLLLAQGELMSTKLFHHFLAEIGVSSSLLMALDFMRIDANDEPDLGVISTKLKPLLSENASIYITQGYICRNEVGEVDNLKRGGSDYTASLIGAASKASEVQIWTDIDGMHNNDPRIVDQTKPIAELSFDEAAELAYFGAKILHPATIRPAKDKNIPVKLLNTMAPEAHGTVISNKTGEGAFKAVAAKDNITAIKIRSGRMLLAYGFLRKVFEVFEKYRTPIDMITTSEVAVSLTIDDDTHLKEIVKELDPFGIVEIDKDQSIVCIAGSFGHENKGVVHQVLDAVMDIPIRMISFGGSRYNISLLIDSSDKETALKALNKGLFGL